jgi:predicted NBD/HSP70 family sugar kinase
MKKTARQPKRRFDLLQEDRASSILARDINRDIILELLRLRQPIARVDLAELSGMQRSTVSLIIEQLIEEKWVVEGAMVRTPRGRPPTMLSLNRDLAILVADIRPSQATLAVIDLNGHFLSREVVRLASDPKIGVSRIAEGMLRLRSQHKQGTFEGVGVSLPGRVDPETHQLILAPNLSAKWTKFDIKAALERELDLQVEMDNAANACLLSELWFGGMQNVRNIVVVTISEGVGTGVLTNGQLVTGRRGLAGEFGHIQIDPAGMLCSCGKRGCWETFASSRAALRHHAELLPKNPSENIMDLMNRADEGEPAALKAIARQAKYIGVGLRMITAALSPDAIVFAGDITACWSRVESVIRAEVEEGMLAGSAPELLPIGDGETARLRGAAALVLQRHAGYHRSTA